MIVYWQDIQPFFLFIVYILGCYILLLHCIDIFFPNKNFLSVSIPLLYIINSCNMRKSCAKLKYDMKSGIPRSAPFKAELKILYRGDNNDIPSKPFFRSSKRQQLILSIISANPRDGGAGLGMVFYGILWYFMVFYGILWYFMVFYGISWYFMVFHGISWFSTFLGWS